MSTVRRQEKVLPAHGPIAHAEYGLTLVMGGWVEIEHGSRLRVEPGALVVVPAGVPHRALRGEEVDLWLTMFCASCIGLDEGHLLMEPFRRVRHGALPVSRVPKSRLRRVERHFRELEEELQRGDPASFELARCHLSLILGEARRAMPGPEKHPPGGSLVAQALTFIQCHALEPISPRDVAAAVHRSPAHLTTAVRRATGHSVGEWITAARVTEAARWLLHSEESLDTIAERVGWRDKTHFIRQFKKAYGQTPAAWRLEARISS
ncbi:MAG: AraC family transcriptional regulator [Holophagales bacterium]|nr:AraC family transcriptional regulator [Holophagales bacterium]